MWKWIVGGLVLVVFALGAMCYFGYKQLTAGGDATSVMIAGTPDRVFAALADPDSMPLWMTSGGDIRSSRHGLLAVGDSLHISSPDTTRRSQQEMTWHVTEVVPGRLLALAVEEDSLGKVVVTRRDSLVQMGDSTLIVATFAVPLMDSIRTAHKDSSRVGGALLGASQKMVVSAFRLAADIDLKQLKAHIEGTEKSPSP